MTASAFGLRIPMSTLSTLFSLSFLFETDALHDLVTFVQFKKRKKHPWRNVTFSKVAGCSHILKQTCS